MIKDFDYGMLSGLVTWTCLWFHSFGKYIFSASHISNTVLRALRMFCAPVICAVETTKQTYKNREYFVARFSNIDYKY